MNETTIAALKKQLDEAETLIDLNAIPHDYSSLKKHVLQLELNQEIQTLRNMLNNAPQSFIETFKKRCVWRETNKEHAISFSEMPESITNKLYWNIAEYLFQPKTMESMLQIIAPGIKHHVSVSINELIPREQKPREYIKDPNLDVKKTASLASLQNPPTPEELSHYILQVMTTYLVRYADSPLSNGLLMKLGLSENKMEALKERWNLQHNPQDFKLD